MKASFVKKELSQYALPEKAKLLASFFKTGKGQYGEGDKFMGVMVPNQRKVAKANMLLPFTEVQKLLNSPIHEHRLTGLLILVYRYGKADEKERKKIFSFYKKNLKTVNNWDLVDVTCPKIIGAYLVDKDRSLLYRYANSKHLWTRRIGIVSTFAFVDRGELKDTFAIAEMLLDDKHDLIHKAVGWALREAGKKDEKQLEKFLDKHVSKMPRTMLRYSLERLPEKRRKYYMKL